jgi:5-methylcytosine-specific restriction endonuclease McrBC regulatory subunit McrC
MVFDRRNCFNAVIRAAACTLIPEVTDPSLRAQLARVSHQLGEQDRPPRRLPLRVPSRSARWQTVYELAIMVLEGFGVVFDPRKLFRAPGFLMDTWRVWQDLVALGLRLGIPSGHLRLQHRSQLGVVVTGGGQQRAVSVRPDAVITLAPGQDVVVDAKYKGRVGESRAGISEGDLYESLAFARATNLSRVLLVYPRVADGPNLATAVGSTTEFERINVGSVSVIGVETEVRGLARSGGLRNFSLGLVDGLRSTGA